MTPRDREKAIEAAKDALWRGMPWRYLGDEEQAAANRKMDQSSLAEQVTDAVLAALSPAEPKPVEITDEIEAIEADEWEAIWYAFDQGYGNLDDGFSQPRDSNRAILQEARRKLEIVHAALSEARTEGGE